MENDGTVSPDAGAEAPAEQEFDYASLEEKVSAGLEAAFGDDIPDDGGNDGGDGAGGGTDSETETGEEVEPGSEAAASESDSGVETETGEAGDELSSSSALPEAVITSLEAYGWDRPTIDANIEALGDKFIATATRIHDGRVSELDKMAAAGASAIEEQTTNAKDNPPALPTAMKPLDAEALKAKYGEDGLIDELIGPVNGMIEAINAVVPSIQQGAEAAQQAELGLVSQRVDEFFGGDSMKPFNEFYGTPETLTDAHVENRNQLLDKAYTLIAGARTLHKRDMPLQEALTNAHEIVSRGFKQENLRDVAVVEAKKRNSGILRKPTAKTAGNPKQDDRTGLEQRTASRLRKAFAS